MINEDLITNILDNADSNFYFFDEDNFVKITDSEVCLEDLFNDFSFEKELDLNEDKPLFLACSFIRYDEYYAPLLFIPIIYSNGVIKRNNNCNILFNEILSLDFSENNLNLLDFTKYDNPQVFYEDLKDMSEYELTDDIFIVNFDFDSLLNYLDLNKNWKTLDDKINVVKSGNDFIKFYNNKNIFSRSRKVLIITNSKNSNILFLFKNSSLLLGYNFENIIRSERNVELNYDDKMIEEILLDNIDYLKTNGYLLFIPYTLCCLFLNEKFESFFDIVFIEPNVTLTDENTISLLLRSKNNYIYKSKPEIKIKNTEFNVKDDYINISVGKLYGEGEFGASKADLRHSGPLYDDRYFRE